MPEVTKRKVTMRNPVVIGYSDEGEPIVDSQVAVDYVLPEHLNTYVADANTRWQSVTVSDEPDAGPGGYHGETTIYAHQSATGEYEYREATEPEEAL